MKKSVFIIALFFIAFVHANEIQIFKNNTNTYYHYNSNPLKFIERGIEFFVFPNGEFDFNTHPRYQRTPYRRTNICINTTYGAPRTYTTMQYNRSVRIQHDYLGRVRRIGNVFLNYDRYGRIKRIGNVYMTYHYNWLSQIGGLHLYYNRYHHIIRTSGFIKPNMGCHFCGGMTCTINHYAQHHNNYNTDHYNQWDDNHWDDDNNEDEYYYRSKKPSKTKKHKSVKR